jgi:hypothetical protein
LTLYSQLKSKDLDRNLNDYNSDNKSKKLVNDGGEDEKNGVHLHFKSLATFIDYNLNYNLNLNKNFL